MRESSDKMRQKVVGTALRIGYEKWKQMTIQEKALVAGVTTSAVCRVEREVPESCFKDEDF